LLTGSFSAWKEVFTSHTNSGSLIGKALVFTLVSVPFLAAECFAIFALSKFTSLSLAVFLFISIALHILFHSY
jgi:hypothetical protein